MFGEMIMVFLAVAAFGGAGPLQARQDDGAKIPWAEGYKGIFIQGLDGGLYPPYSVTTVERAQRALIDRGLYAGPVNGVLDAPTMQAIYSFQKATRVLQVCGVPTPRTRKMLEQGSHTDPAPH